MSGRRCVERAGEPRARLRSRRQRWRGRRGRRCGAAGAGRGVPEAGKAEREAWLPRRVWGGLPPRHGGLSLRRAEPSASQQGGAGPSRSPLRPRRPEAERPGWRGRRKEPGPRLVSAAPDAEEELGGGRRGLAEDLTEGPSFLPSPLLLRLSLCPHSQRERRSCRHRGCHGVLVGVVLPPLPGAPSPCLPLGPDSHRGRGLSPASSLRTAAPGSPPVLHGQPAPPAAKAQPLPGGPGPRGAAV